MILLFLSALVQIILMLGLVVYIVYQISKEDVADISGETLMRAIKDEEK